MNPRQAEAVPVSRLVRKNHLLQESSCAVPRITGRCTHKVVFFARAFTAG